MTADGRLLEVENLVVHYPVPRGLVGTVARRPRRLVHAVDGVSFTLARGELLALVGESGCGKTTTAQTVLRLVDPAGGTIAFDGRDITSLANRELRPLRRRMQISYQDPYESLDPRLTVRGTIEEPLLIHRLGGSKRERAELVRDALERVELTPRSCSSTATRTSSPAASASASRSRRASCSRRTCWSRTSPSRCSMSPCEQACSRCSTGCARRVSAS
jgi:ABC-type glutathione transport system ATPase component